MKPFTATPQRKYNHRRIGVSSYASVIKGELMLMLMLMDWENIVDSYEVVSITLLSF
jgi:hypothetical protein